MRLLNHVLEVNLRARRKWSDPVLIRQPYYSRFVIGKLSLLWGQPHLEPVTVCCDCGEATTGLSAGDESWTYCEGCQSIEPRTEEITTEEYERRQS